MKIPVSLTTALFLSRIESSAQLNAKNDRRLLSVNKMKNKLWKSCTDDLDTDTCSALCALAPDMCNNICTSLKEAGNMETVIKLDFCDCNDELGDYVDVDLGSLPLGGTVSYQGDNTGFPIQDMAEKCSQTIDGPTVWFKVDIEAGAQDIVVSLCNSAANNGGVVWDSQINVHGCDVCYGYADDECGVHNGFDQLKFQAVGPDTLYIAVSGYVEAYFGAFTLDITSTAV